jgi:hypothetical protein
MIIINVREVMKILIRIGVIGSLAFLAGYATADEYPAHAPMKVNPFLHAGLTRSESMFKKYDGLFMNVSKSNPDLNYFLLRGETYGESASDRVKLDDEDFIKAVKETEGRLIYQLRVKNAMLTHNAIDALKNQSQLRMLDLSGNKLITDEACKKIAKLLPRLHILNLFNTNITDRGLEYLIHLQELKKLHVTGTQVTWNGANLFRAKMLSVAGNDDLEITTGKQPLGSIKRNEWLRSHYQTNAELSNIDEETILKKHLLTSPDTIKSNKSYEEDKKKELEGPVLEQ